jgi:hypothetical protein
MDGHVTFYDNVAEPPQLVGNSNSSNPGNATVNIVDAIDSSENVKTLDPSGTISD